jgi:hypothetical protein
MSDVENMYRAPEKLGEIQTPLDGAAGVSPDTRLFIGQAAPWLKFMGVMGFIGCGFMALAAIISMVTGSFMSIPGMYAGLGGGYAAGIGAFYLVCAVLMFFPARFIFKMGTAASVYKLQGQTLDLQELVSNLKKWAKFNGILTIVGIAIGIIAFIGVIIYSVTIASKNL